MTELILPACELYRTGRLPFPRWWRPDELTGTLIRWYARWRLAAANEGVVAAELAGRWHRSEDEAIEILVNASAPIVDAPAIFVEPGHDPPSRWLRKVAALKEFREVVDAALARYPAALHERDDLLAMARYCETHDAIAERLNDAEGWHDPVVGRAVEQLSAAFEASTQVLLSLAPYERNLLEPAGTLESLFARELWKSGVTPCSSRLAEGTRCLTASAGHGKPPSGSSTTSTNRAAGSCAGRPGRSRTGRSSSMTLARPPPSRRCSTTLTTCREEVWSRRPSSRRSDSS